MNTVFKVGSGKMEEEKDSCLDIFQLEGYEYAGTYTADHVNIAVYMSGPAYVVVHNCFQVSDVGHHESFT